MIKKHPDRECEAHHDNGSSQAPTLFGITERDSDDDAKGKDYGVKIMELPTSLSELT